MQWIYGSRFLFPWWISYGAAGQAWVDILFNPRLLLKGPAHEINTIYLILSIIIALLYTSDLVYQFKIKHSLMWYIDLYKKSVCLLSIHLHDYMFSKSALLQLLYLETFWFTCSKTLPLSTLSDNLFSAMMWYSMLVQFQWYFPCLFSIHWLSISKFVGILYCQREFSHQYRCEIETDTV